MSNAVQRLREVIQQEIGPLIPKFQRLAAEQRTDAALMKRMRTWPRPFLHLASPAFQKTVRQRDIDQARAHMEQVLREFFNGLAEEGAELVLEHHAEHEKKFAGLKPRIVGVRMSYEQYQAHKAASAPPDAEALISKLEPDWEYLVGELQDDFQVIAQSGAAQGLAQLNVNDQKMLSRVNSIASEWAGQRAAELVGRKRTSNGKLVPNRDARYSIDDSTRDSIRSIIEDAFSQGATMEELAERIRTAAAFSEQRAATIASNEASRSESMGNLLSWRESKQVRTVSIVLSSDHDADDECNDAADGSPYDINGGDLPDLPIHVNCSCSYVIGSLKDEDEV